MQLIADILSCNNNQELLSKHLKHNIIDWDAVVVIGSKHLMLPAIYCKLKDKGLSELIPTDLNIYLKEITNINRGRNETLLSEAQEISRIFQEAHINHVFIKGIALLAAQTYNDNAERMIGDIDILVAKNQLHAAFEILINHGYTDTVNTIIEFKNRRHLPRQISKEKYGAIEIHSEILRHEHRHLITNEEILKNKRIINAISIPSIEDSIKISILAFQINDKAHLYGYFGLKTIYDCLALNLMTKPHLIKNLSEEKHFQSFMEMSSIFFKELVPYKSSIYSLILKRYYIFKLKHHKLGFIISSLIHTSININLRLNLLLHNKSYRTHILKNKFLLTKT